MWKFNTKAVFELFSRMSQGSVAEWSKALVLGTSHFGGVGSNPTTIKRVFGEIRQKLDQKFRHHDHKRFSEKRQSGWPSGLRRCVQVAVYLCRRGFESHFWQRPFWELSIGISLIYIIAIYHWYTRLARRTPQVLQNSRTPLTFVSRQRAKT